jgi:vacuolar-type H+-ATPase subunit I/STV1
MSELKIHVEDQYLPALLSYLQSLSYIRVEQIKEKKGSKQKKTATSATERYLATLSPTDPMRQAIKPMRENVTADQLFKEGGSIKTDWNMVRQIGIEMNITQTTEELLAQLTP